MLVSLLLGLQEFGFLNLWLYLKITNMQTSGSKLCNDGFLFVCFLNAANTHKKQLLQFEIAVFYMTIYKNEMYFCDAKLNFQHHYSSLQNSLQIIYLFRLFNECKV